VKYVLPVLVFFFCFGCLSQKGTNKKVGDLAEDLLSDEYNSIVIEIDYQIGAMPNVSSLTFFRDKVAKITNKTVFLSLDDEILDGDIETEYSDV